jgi:hypothetical protein
MTRLAVLLPVLVLLVGCKTVVSVERPAEQCASILPDDWVTKPPNGPLTGTVPHDDFPGATADTGQWIAHAQAEGDQLDTANGRMGAAVTIIQRCESHDAALVASLTKPWWKVW